MPTDTALSIVIITLNEERNIGRLLQDLRMQTHQQFEVIVVDSNSDDRTVEIATQFSHYFNEFQLVQMSKRGVSLGRNTGAQHASHERLLFLDADVRLAPEFLAQAIESLHHHQLQVAGGRMRTSNKQLAVKTGIRLFDLGMLATQHLFPTAVGACIFSTRTLHQQLGGFNEAIRLCEDCDYVNRASRLSRFRMLPVFFDFDTRRLLQDGVWQTGTTYLKANAYRLVFGELTRNQIRYDFGHYSSGA